MIDFKFRRQLGNIKINFDHLNTWIINFTHILNIFLISFSIVSELFSKGDSKIL
jgi:hypothetical protein